MKINNKWFSIIEVLVWIFIFAIGLVSTYFLIVYTMSLNDYSKNSIIASNLSREWIELVRNVRDSNYLGYYKWNKMPWSDVYNLFQTWVYYRVENDFSNNDENVKITKINDFKEWAKNIENMEDYRLCLDENNIYTYDCSTNNSKTYFYRYIKFDDVKYKTSTWVVIIKDALKLTSNTIWYNRGYHEVRLDTILTDFQKQ
jgi:hypothetical protein